MSSESCFFVADISHHAAGTANPVTAVVEYVHALDKRQGRSAASGITWFARSDQRALLPNSSGIVEECSSALTPKELVERVGRVFPSEPKTTWLVLFSYDRAGLAAVTQSFSLAAVLPVGIASLPGFIAIQPTPGISLTPETPVGRHDPPLTFGRVLSIVKHVLQTKRAYSAETGMNLTQLRPAIINEDIRAAKDQSEPVSKSLISHVLRDGEQNKWLQVDRSRGSGRESVYLRGMAEKSPASYSPQTVEAPRSTISLPASASAESPAQKERSRDRVMIDALCAKGVAMWTPGELRELLCEAVRAMVIGAAAPINVQALIEEAVAVSKAAAEAAKYPYTVKWASTGQCFLRNLIAAEVLIEDSGKSIRNHWTAGAKNVKDLAGDWELKVEGALVLAILRAVPNVTLADEYSLALALYQRGQERGIKTTELLKKIAIVIEFLEQTGAINIDGDSLAVARPQVLTSHA